MQHRYVPDLGDFSKFAVIDALSGQGAMRTALIWYLVDPHELGEGHKNDGKHTTYLHEDRHGYTQCHPVLYRRFQAIHAAGEKHVGVYARHKVLPNVVYFSELLSYDGKPATQRESWRAQWRGRAVQAADSADMVLLDPDNGLMTHRVSVRSKSAVKYATLDECAAFHGGGARSLVVYQHGHRQGTIAEQADAALRRLADQLGVKRSDAFALRFHRGTTRCYLVVPAAAQREAIRHRARALIDSAWGERGHFSMID